MRLRHVQYAITREILDLEIKLGCMSRVRATYKQQDYYYFSLWFILPINKNCIIVKGVRVGVAKYPSTFLPKPIDIPQPYIGAYMEGQICHGFYPKLSV